MVLLAATSVFRGEPSIAPAQSADPALAVEVAAARAMLAGYHPRFLGVDPRFARAGEAPPAPTGELRPAARNRALTDSLSTLVVPSGTDSLVIQASVPSISRTDASISMTVSGRSGGSRGVYYETIALTLRRERQSWRVVGRRQLGIT
jgi:hypothetical protein